MVKLPEVVSVETEIINGETVVKQMYADGSYGVDVGKTAVEVYYPNKDVRVFQKTGDNEYALIKENLSDGTVRRWNEYGVKSYEKLPNGEERRWDIFFNTPYIEKEVIPGEVTRHYRLTGNFSRRGRLLPNTAFNYLAKEEFADGREVEYYRSRTEKIKKSEKLHDGVLRSFYEDGVTVKSEEFENGNVINYREVKGEKIKKSEKLQDGVLRTFYEDGVTVKSEEFENGDFIEYYDSKDKKVKSSKTDKMTVTFYDNGVKKSEELPGGIRKEWDSEGRITHEVRADKTVVDYKYDKAGNLVYHAVNGKEDTLKYMAMKRVALRQAEKSEKLRERQAVGANGEQRQVVKKLNRVQKAVQMARAMREVKKDLQNR